MSKPKRATPATPLGAIEWAGVQVQRVPYEAGATIFTQGDPADSVMYVAQRRGTAVRAVSCGKRGGHRGAGRRAFFR
jgi:CRP-like cAMP-binding protein